MNKKAVLLINLGTPAAASPSSVRRYLREFLNDPRVVDLPAILRWPLVNFFIVPFRNKRITLAYQKIWMENGSPLRVISEKIKTALAKELGGEYFVELGMRYGFPDIETALTLLRQHDFIILLPLFPQYSAAATGSALQASLSLLSRQWNIPEIKAINHFYDQPGFIAASAEIIRQTIGTKKIDKIIFSYHGLPERHIIKSHCKAKCDHVQSCPPVNRDNSFCYRAQCYATTRLIAEKLGLSIHEYEVAFQSRLGRTPWIKPYTDLLLPALIQKGIKNIAMVSPSFTADCLETLDEINIRTRQQWQALGGGEFIFVPCVNDHPLWIKALAEIIRQ